MAATDGLLDDRSPAPRRPGVRVPFSLRSYLALGPYPGAVPCARLHARLVLAEWGLAALAETAELVVSELMTNAADASIVLPERPPIALRLLATETCLLIEAWDQSPLDLDPHEADADDECGRGLTVVAALSDRWGCERTGRRLTRAARCACPRRR